MLCLQLTQFDLPILFHSNERSLKLASQCDLPSDLLYFAGNPKTSAAKLTGLYRQFTTKVYNSSSLVISSVSCVGDSLQNTCTSRHVLLEDGAVAQKTSIRAYLTTSFSLPC